MKNLKSIWLDVFRAGEQTDSAGNTRTWSLADLDTIVERYNSQEAHEAPVVIGHPDTDKPAFGWVDKLERRGDTLYAHLKDLTDEFIEWLEAKHYKKRSIALYEDLLLKHIGFLGAVPPAVKGLKNPEFLDADSISIEIESSEQAVMLTPDKFAEHSSTGADKELQELISKVRHLFNSDGKIKSQFLEVPAELLTKQQLLQVINEQATQKETEKFNLTNFINNLKRFNMDEQIKEMFAKLIEWQEQAYGAEAATQLSAKIDEFAAAYTPAAANDTNAPAEAAEQTSTQHSEQDERVAELQEKIQRLETQNRLREFNAFAETLIRDNKLVPAQTELVISALEMAHSQKKVQFNEAGKAKQREAVELVKELINSYPAFNQLTAEAPKGNKPGTEYSEEFAGMEIDSEAFELHVKVRNYQAEQEKAGTTVTYEQALDKIINGGK